MKMNNTLSDYFDITCGVQQGTIPGLLLFLIHTNNLKTHALLGK